MNVGVLAVLIAASVLGGFAFLTGLGARRRGNSLEHSVVQGALFPATWVAWFVADNVRSGRTAFQGHDRDNDTLMDRGPVPDAKHWPTAWVSFLALCLLLEAAAASRYFLILSWNGAVILALIIWGLVTAAWHAR